MPQILSLERKEKKDWFNVRCVIAKKKRDEAWKKMKRNRDPRNKENFKLARNNCTEVKKEEEREYEKDVMEKCKEQPKLLYIFINRKIKLKKDIERLREEHGMTDDLKSMAELLNNRFCQVFT